MLKTKEKIEDWLNKHEIKNYIINDDLTVDVNGDVRLEGRGIKKIPFKFNKVIGDFNIGINYLTTLNGSPEIVSGDFFCNLNKLKTLEYSPKEVGGSFDCSSNELITLIGCTQEIGISFGCSSNKLTSLKYSPKKVLGSFYCNDNKLTALEELPEIINGKIYCKNNPFKDHILNELEGNEVKNYLVSKSMVKNLNDTITINNSNRKIKI